MHDSTSPETDDDVLNSFERNTYTATVPIRINEFNSYEELELTVVETVAKSIVDHVDHLDDGDASYVATKVNLNSDELEDVYENGADDLEIVQVETNTHLGLVTEE